MNLNKQVPDINPLQYDIRQLLKAAQSLNDFQPITGEWILRKFLKGTYYEHILVDNVDHIEDHESVIMNNSIDLKPGSRSSENSFYFKFSV